MKKVLSKAASTKLANKIVSHVDKCVKHLFDVDRGQLKHIPNFIIFLIYVLCISVIVQAGLDLILEALMIGGFIEAIPFRVNFIFLTVLSTIMGIQTMKGMSRLELDVTRNSILIGIVVEFALIIGDVILIIEKSATTAVLPFIRLPFLVLTCLNLGILIYVAKTLKVFTDEDGGWSIF